MGVIERGAISAVATAVGLVVVLLAGVAGGGVVPVTDATGGAGTQTAVATGAPMQTALSSPTAAQEFDSERISGSVTDENGSPILNAVVSVDETGDATTTNVAGFYSLELEAGEYNVTVSADGYEPWTGTLTTDKYARHDITLSTAPTELEGTVTNATADEPIENATIEILETGNETTTDANGSFRFPLEPGTYTLETRADGYRTWRTTVTVREHETTRTEIRVTPAEESEDDEDEDESEGDGDADGPDDSPGNESDAENGTDDADEDDGVTGETGGEPSEPPTVREQVLTVLLYAGLFLGAMISAATVGLYRDRLQRS